MGSNIPLLSFSFAKLKTQSFIPHFLSQFNSPFSGLCLFLGLPSALYKSSQESHMFPGYASPDATSRGTSQGIFPFPAVAELQQLSVIVRFSKTPPLLAADEPPAQSKKTSAWPCGLLVLNFIRFPFLLLSGSVLWIVKASQLSVSYRLCICTHFLQWPQIKMFR